jgi:uncharacterized protein (DUF849 family)
MNRHPIAINFCPTGMVPTRQQTPHVPISVSEIVESVHEASGIGITIAHLHARLDDGTPTDSSAVYSRIFDGVRKHCPDVVICGSSSGRNWPEFERRAAVLDLQPEMCSLTLSSLNFAGGASVNEPDMIARLAARMQERGVVPELECFDPGMINYGKYLIGKGILKGPLYWNLIFGNVAGMQATPSEFAAALHAIPGGYVAVGGIGRAQLKANAMALAEGLGVRVGLEDNFLYDRARTVLASNTQLLRRLHRMMAEFELGPMPGAEFRLTVLGRSVAAGPSSELSSMA